MDLLNDAWLKADYGAWIAPTQLGEPQWHDLLSLRPDFRGASHQFLIGLLQLAYPPRDVKEWRERWNTPPTTAELTIAFAAYRDAFLLDNPGGPAFIQDLDLPADANRLPVLDLLIDAGSDSNLFFNKPVAEHALCECCAAQALLTLQLNAPAGGRGVRTSLRGGGPLTTLLMPADASATLWQKLWLNVLPLDALAHPPVEHIGDVLPWMSPTRTSDGADAQETQPQWEPVRGPQHVHPLQAYWSMPRRIRLDMETTRAGICAICGEEDARLIQHFRTRHGGTNYTGSWQHPLTPYYIDAKGEKPPISAKGHQAGRGYRDWLGLVLGSEDHQPDAARVVDHFTARIRRTDVGLWCFGYSMSNMKALCWYDSTLPVHAVEPGLLPAFTARVKQLLDHANEVAGVLQRQVKAARFDRPGDAKSDPAVPLGFWQRSERLFYDALARLASIDPEDDAAFAPLCRRWLSQTRRIALQLFDEWTASAPAETLDLERIVKASAGLRKELSTGKCAKPLWAIVNTHREKAA
jgi:CRISPR system Cascade subunit CasA